MPQHVGHVDIDPARNVFRAHVIGADRKVFTRRKPPCAGLLRIFSSLPPRLDDVVACASVRHRGRKHLRPGHDLQSMAPACVSAGKLTLPTPVTLKAAKRPATGIVTPESVDAADV
jgi:hypothetical protein